MNTLQSEKNKKIIRIFSSCSQPQDIYKKIISLGNTLKPFDLALKSDENRVYGCQSLMYLYAKKRGDQKLEFFATSDALISKGLAALMLEIYNFEKACTILKLNPKVLEQIKIFTSLSPNRINGLRAFYLKLNSLSKEMLN